VVGTTEQGKPTAGRSETDGRQTVGPIGFTSQQTERHFAGPCAGTEEGVGLGSESKES
jgi:hypothetical protein